jgi:predicted O-linked N-acetylglucosamine transferase (SPINDLY family)
MKPGRNDPCPCGSGRKYKQCCGAEGRAPTAAANVPQMLQSAFAYHRGGQLQQAEALYRQALAAQPSNPDALHLLGVLSQQSGRSADAVELIGRAVAVNPAFPQACFNLGVALKSLGRVEEAAAAYQQAIALQPDYAEAHDNLGNALTELGRDEEAAACYRHALAVNPASAITHNNLGIALKSLGRLDEAVACFRQATALKPDYANAYYNLGNAWKQMGLLADAVAAYQRAVALQADFAEAYNNLGTVLNDLGRPTEAVAAWRRSIALVPTLADTHNNLGNGLKDLGELEQAIASYRRALELNPELMLVRSSLLFCLHYQADLDDAALYAAHREFAARHAQPLAAEIQPHRNSRDPARPLRIGYVSADFREHPVGYYFEPVLAAHDQTQYEIYCYANVTKPDHVSARLQAQCKLWRDVAALDDAALARIIREDAIDILVDLSGYTAGNRLLTFARKPAPVQVTWLGYFDTTALDAMDYAIWDDATLPPAAERWFTEKIIRMPDSRFCYRPPGYAPPVAALPAAARGVVTFGCFNNLSKITPEVVALWARVLQAAPHARLLLKWASFADASVRERYLELFATHGIGADRLELRGASPHQQMLAEYGDMDIALDPFPYSGGLTSCEALWMGVPLVTLAGPRPVSRQTLGYLSLLNLQELAAASEDQYVQIAADLARDFDRLADLRAGLRDTMAASPLCDGPRFARNLEQRYRAIWEAWCANPDSAKIPQ